MSAPPQGKRAIQLHAWLCALLHATWALACPARGARHTGPHVGGGCEARRAGHVEASTGSLRLPPGAGQSVDGFACCAVRWAPGREKRQEWDLLNDNKAIWLRKPSEVTEEEYQKFYKAVSKVG